MNRFFYIFIIFTICSCSSNTVLLEPVRRKEVYPILSGDNVIRFSEISTGNKAVALLNQLFNSDAQNNNMVLVINNESECDFVMRIEGNQNYSVPVASRKSESIVLERGNYVLNSEVCQMQYHSRKTFTENTLISIKATFSDNPTNK